MLEFTIGEDGRFNIFGDKLTSDELIELYECEGYRAIRTFENTKVYVTDENGIVKEETKKCEVIRFK